MQDILEKGELMQCCKTEVEMNFATAFWEEMCNEKWINQGKVVTVNEIRNNESLAEGFQVLGWVRKGATATAYC